MKLFAVLMLLLSPALAQEVETKGNPILLISVELKRPSVHSPSYERPSLEITVTNLSDKPVNALSFDVDFWDYRHNAKIDTITGALGDINPKNVLLKSGQKKTLRHSLGDYFPPDSWMTDASKLRIYYVKYTDGSHWIHPDKLK
jgi:hypothetical protein